MGELAFLLPDWSARPDRPARRPDLDALIALDRELAVVADALGALHPGALHPGALDLDAEAFAVDRH